MVSKKKSKWIFEEENTEKISDISKTYNISPLLAKIISNRFDDAKMFFDSENLFHSPDLLSGINEASERIKKAIDAKEKIVVYGDYDVDGITSTYILTDYLKSCGAFVDFYIPDRAKEGYGLCTSAINMHKKNGASLIVTVDLGITAFDEAKYCKEIGIDLIITDHHSLCETSLPDCTAVINPKIPGYPFKNLAGVGVAYKLIYKMCGGDKRITEKYLPFAAIGTIADLVELYDENRYIVKEGLRLLKNTDNIGIKALFEACGADIKNVCASTIGFMIGPRLNAAGRLSSADISVKLLNETDKENAKIIADELNTENECRKSEEQKILKEALEIIEKDKLYENEVIVVAKDNWHHGVIGIVSSKITDMFYKPSIVISTDENSSPSKASGRSIEGFNLFDALSHCKDILIKFGGHSLAAGLSIEKEKIGSFNRMINEYAKEKITEEIATPKILIDAECSLENISLETANELKTLEPFGMGNTTPCFCINSVTISQIKFSSNHAFITSSKDSSFITMPAFNMKDEVSSFLPGDIIDVCGNIGINTYKGVDYPQFIIRDIRPSHFGFINRKAVLNVYMIIKNLLGGKKLKTSSEDLAKLISEKFNAKISINKLCESMKILSDLELIEFKQTENGLLIYEKQNFLKKTNIEKSKTYLLYNEKRRK